MDKAIVSHVFERIKNEVTPVSRVIDQLHKNGYLDNFELVGNRLRCTKNRHYYSIPEVQVDEIYHFEDDSGILSPFYLYALRVPWDDLKGIFMIEDVSTNLNLLPDL